MLIYRSKVYRFISNHSVFVSSWCKKLITLNVPIYVPTTQIVKMCLQISKNLLSLLLQFSLQGSRGSRLCGCRIRMNVEQHGWDHYYKSDLFSLTAASVSPQKC